MSCMPSNFPLEVGLGDSELGDRSRIEILVNNGSGGSDRA